tara:strand:- start:2083 stop:2670 length:588 start_codon:yes stop_codon:yes gene_type:complete
MNKHMFTKRFGKFFDTAYRRWRIDNEKAGKDIIGEEYETFRAAYWTALGATVVTDKKEKRIGSYDPDLAIKKSPDGDIVLIEEDKGHYVDSCFLKRAMHNFGDVIVECIEQNKEPPYFILSCPTRMNNFDEVFNKSLRPFREDVQAYFREKFFYSPLCEHGRVRRNRYYTSDRCCFTLSDSYIEKEISLLRGILK